MLRWPHRQLTGLRAVTGQKAARQLGVGLGLAVALVAVRSPQPAHAKAARSELPDRVWVTDGTVFALASTPQGVFAGGDFTLIGPETGRWVNVTASGSVL